MAGIPSSIRFGPARWMSASGFQQITCRKTGRGLRELLFKVRGGGVGQVQSARMDAVVSISARHMRFQNHGGVSGNGAAVDPRAAFRGQGPMRRDIIAEVTSRIRFWSC